MTGSIIINSTHYILLGSLLLISGVITTKFSSKFGVPALVLFILVGMIAGSDGIGLIYFDNARIAQGVGILALIIIVFDGGLLTNKHTVKNVIKPSIVLATLGVLITSIIVGLGAVLILKVSIIEGLLFGAIVGSTDAAAVFAVLKGKNIQTKMASTLEVESGSNDPMAMFLTISMINLLTMDNSNLFFLILSFFWQMGLGAFLGFFLGKAASYSINYINLESSGLYPVFALSFALLTYSLTDLLMGSGLLAVYVSALVIGNRELTYRHSIFKFNEGFAWMMQIWMFVILGLFVFPSELFTWDIVFKGLALAFILIFIARPVAVFVSIIKCNFSNKEKIFLSWAGLKGAVPIVLATFPMINGMENSQLFFNVVFFVVLISALVQGSTVSLVAEKLKLTGPKKVESPYSIELVAIGKANAEIIEFEVNEEVTFLNKFLEEIDFPRDVLINAIIRNGELITPTGQTKILLGDIIYVLVARKSKVELEKMLHG
jgi:cell volume regulation protein A